MIDRLCELQGTIPPLADTHGTPGERQDGVGDGDDDDRDPEQHAVVFAEDVLGAVYKEVHSLRKEIALLRLDVKRLEKQNSRFLTSVRRISSIKRDANSLGRAIKTRGEGVYARLEKLRRRSEELAAEHGVSSALARMVRSQTISLTRAFHGAMSEFSEAELVQKENCKKRIQRQAQIVGKELTLEHIEEMVETGKCSVFSGNALMEGRVSKSAMSEIESRHKELLELEGRLRELYEIFSQLSKLLEEQGCMLDNIEANVCATQNYVEKAVVKFREAGKYKEDNPCKRFFCCCFPCCK